MASKIPMRPLRINDELYQKVCVLAKAEHRSFNQQCAFILDRFVADFEARHGAIPVPAPEQSAEPDTQ